MEIKKLSQDYQKYLQDESRLQGRAESICFPETEKDLEWALTYSRDQGKAMTFQGSRTGITAGAVPGGGLLINLENMDRITGISRDSEGHFLIRCQPGIKLIDLRKVIYEKRYNTDSWDQLSQKIWQEFIKNGRWFFPPDPTETSASLGGMASCNASGARSFRYGSVRRWITGLEIIPFPEISAKISREYLRKFPSTLKNAAGYFLQEDRRDFDIFIGAEGTLGIISGLEIKLQPYPKYFFAIMQFFDNKEEALNFSHCLRESKDKPDAIEYFDTASLQLLRESRQLWQELPDLKEHWRSAVYYEYSANDEDRMDDMVFLAAKMAEQNSSTEKDCWFVDNEKDLEKLKNFRHALPEAINLRLDRIRLKYRGIAKISTDLSVPEGKLNNMIGSYQEAVDDGWQVIVFGHIGNNHLHTNILPRNEMEYREGKKMAESWAKSAVQLNGSVSGEHGIGKTKKHLLKLMYNTKELDQMRRIKKIIDPENIFNSGNIF